MPEDQLMGMIEGVTLAVELTGIAAIVIGGIISGAIYARSAFRDPGRAYRQFRSNLGRAILLGLELLIAADIINTVAIEPTLLNVAVLAGIVLVRTFLSFSLELEIEGRWPWQRAGNPSCRDGEVAAPVAPEGRSP